MKNAIILVAGKSDRFAPFTYEKPKGLFCVKGDVLIERQIEQLHEAGINEIYVVIGYMAVIKMTKEKGSALTATPYQLLGSRDSEDTSQKFVDRDKYIQIACPQGFRFEYLLDIYQRAENKGIVDKTETHTTSLMYALGDNVNYAYGDQTNIKITNKEDIKLFEVCVLMKKLSGGDIFDQ